MRHEHHQTLSQHNDVSNKTLQPISRQKPFSLSQIPYEDNEKKYLIYKPNDINHRSILYSNVCTYFPLSSYNMICQIISKPDFFLNLGFYGYFEVDNNNDIFEKLKYRKMKVKSLIYIGFIF